MPVIMMMMVVMVAMAIHLFQATFTGTESGAEIAIFDIAARGGNACTFDMMMVAFLRQADFIFKAEHLRAIFTHRAVHVVAASENFTHAIGKGGDHLIMIIEVACLDELDIGVAGGDFISEAVNTVDENAGKEEIGKNDNPLETKLGDVFKARLDQREGHA